MKKVIFLTAYCLFIYPLFAAVPCQCKQEEGNTMTTTTYFAEGGCCSGVVQDNDFALIEIWEKNEGTTYSLIDTNVISAQAGQSNCCNQH